MGWDGNGWVCGRWWWEGEEGVGGGGRSEDAGLGKESGREHQPALVSSTSLANFPPQIAHCSFWLIVY